jgi:hypothetical protein
MILTGSLPSLPNKVTGCVTAREEIQEEHRLTFCGIVLADNDTAR